MKNESIQRQEAHFSLRRIPYYFHACTQLFRLCGAPGIVALLKGIALHQPFILTDRRNNIHLMMLTALDALVFVEVYGDAMYDIPGKNRELHTIVDIGAGFGDYSILMAKQNPKARVYAIEPHPKYFSLLVENVNRNFVRNCIPISGFIRSITDINRLTGKKVIDRIKIDCEGCEFSLLHHHSKNIFRTIYSITMEYHEDPLHSGQDLERMLMEYFPFVRRIPSDVFGLGMIYAKKEKSIASRIRKNRVRYKSYS